MPSLVFLIASDKMPTCRLGFWFAGDCGRHIVQMVATTPANLNKQSTYKDVFAVHAPALLPYQCCWKTSAETTVGSGSVACHMVPLPAAHSSHGHLHVPSCASRAGAMWCRACHAGHGGGCLERQTTRTAWHRRHTACLPALLMRINASARHSSQFYLFVSHVLAAL